MPFLKPQRPALSPRAGRPSARSGVIANSMSYMDSLDRHTHVQPAVAPASDEPYLQVIDGYEPRAAHQDYTDTLSRPQEAPHREVTSSPNAFDEYMAVRSARVPVPEATHSSNLDVMGQDTRYQPRSAQPKMFVHDVVEDQTQPPSAPYGTEVWRQASTAAQSSPAEDLQRRKAELQKQLEEQRQITEKLAANNDKQWSGDAFMNGEYDGIPMPLDYEASPDHGLPMDMQPIQAYTPRRKKESTQASHSEELPMDTQPMAAYMPRSKNEGTETLDYEASPADGLPMDMEPMNAYMPRNRKEVTQDLPMDTQPMEAFMPPYMAPAVPTDAYKYTPPTVPPPVTMPPAVKPTLDVPDFVASDPIFLDEAAMLEARTFAIPPSKLILLAKRFLVSREGKSGYWQNAWGDFLSGNFEYWGPTTGPLSKQEFIKADAAVDLDKGFPDMTREFYGFVVDPVNYNRVWYTARSRGTHEGPLPPVATTPTGKVVVSPPQACSLTFGEDGLITKFTDGYVMDRTEGNTGGLGGLYGVYNAIGKPLPFPEAQPYKMSKRQMLYNAVL